MKANELMVGDWVCYNAPNKFYTKVEEIRCKDKGEIYYIRGYRDSKDPSSERLIFGDFSMDILHSIPLTPEILEKNGWEKRPTGYVFYIDGKRYDNSLWYVFDSNTFVVNTAEFQIKYVHQLQHALRLCDIDKEIVL